MRKNLVLKIVIIVLVLVIVREIYYLISKEKITRDLREKIESKEEVVAIYDDIYGEVNNSLSNSDVLVKLDNEKLALEEEKSNLEVTIGLLKVDEDNLNKRRNSLKEQLQVLKTNREEQIRKESEVLINNVITYYQFPSYPTGCESIALYILLKYYDINLSPMDIVDNLKKGPLPYYENDLVYGANPEKEFVGNPLDDSSYGVYNEPIKEVANLFKDSAISVSNFPFSEVLSLVKDGIPVLVWNTMGMSIPYYSSSWLDRETGEMITWIRGEHALVVIGYDNNNVIVSDPYTGTIRYFDKYTFEQRYNFLGRRAIYYEG